MPDADDEVQVQLLREKALKARQDALDILLSNDFNEPIFLSAIQTYNHCIAYIGDLRGVARCAESEFLIYEWSRGRKCVRDKNRKCDNNCVAFIERKEIFGE